MMLTQRMFMGLFIIFHWKEMGAKSIVEARGAWDSWEAYERGRGR
jgi:hypothetical protein